MLGEHIKVGAVVISLSHKTFSDGTSHCPGDLHTVTDETLAYYQVCHKDYVVISTPYEVVTTPTTHSI